MKITFNWKQLSRHTPNENETIVLTGPNSKKNMFFICKLVDVKNMPVDKNKIYITSTIHELRRSAIIDLTNLVNDTCFQFNGFWYDSCELSRDTSKDLYIAELWSESCYWDYYVKEWTIPEFKDMNKVENFF